MGQFGQALMNVGGYLLNRSAEDRKYNRDMEYQRQVDAQKAEIEQRKLQTLEALRKLQGEEAQTAIELNRTKLRTEQINQRIPRYRQAGGELIVDQNQFDDQGNFIGVQTSREALKATPTSRAPSYVRTTIVDKATGKPMVYEYPEGNPSQKVLVGEAPPKGGEPLMRIGGRTEADTVRYYDRVDSDIVGAKRDAIGVLASQLGADLSGLDLQSTAGRESAKRALLKRSQEQRTSALGQFQPAGATAPQAPTPKTPSSPLSAVVEGVKALGSKVVNATEQMTPEAVSLRLADQVGTNGLDPQEAISTWRKMFPDKSFSFTDPKTGKQVGHDATKPPVEGAQKDDNGNWWILDKETGKYRPVFYE